MHVSCQPYTITAVRFKKTLFAILLWLVLLIKRYPLNVISQRIYYSI